MKLKQFACASFATLLAATSFACASGSDAPAPSTDLVIKDTAAHAFTYSSEVSMGNIVVTMAQTGKVFVNPYSIEIKVGEGSSQEVLGSDKIVSAPVFIKSESDTGLKVSITPTVTPSSGVYLVTKDEMAQTGNNALTNKSLNLGFQIASATDGETAPTWASVPIIDLGDPEIKGQVTDTNLVIAKGDTAATYAAFRITGDAVANPTKLYRENEIPDPWTESNTVDVSIAFTFTPNNTPATPPPTPPAASFTVSLDQSTLTLSDAGSYQETLVATPSTGALSDYTVTWTSSDESVAKVDANGQVTLESGVSSGTTTITVTLEKGGETATATCVVTATA